MQSSDIVAFYPLVYSGAKATAGASQSKAHPQPQVTVTYVARALACGGASMDRVFERILTSLMPSLRHLAVDRTVDQVKGARRAIWMSYSGLVNEADRQRFRDKLRKQAINEEKKERPEQEKLFWRDVVQYVSASLGSKD